MGLRGEKPANDVASKDIRFIQRAPRKVESCVGTRNPHDLIVSLTPLERTECGALTTADRLRPTGPSVIERSLS